VIFSVDGYITDRGRAPFQDALDWFEATDQKLSDKVALWLRDYLPDSTYHVMPHVEPLGSKLYALRVSQAKNEARIFFTMIPDRKILLLNGYCKKTKKIPKEQLNLARTLCSTVQNKY
jgi:phage-related protein